MRAIVRRFAIVAVVALALVPARALAAPTVVLPADTSPYGHTYSEWAANWWQWVLTQPASVNPLVDDTGANCAQGQSGPVWYLAGSFAGTPINRGCSVPAGRALLVPVVNFAYFAFETDPADQRTEEFVRSMVAVGGAAASLVASIDGATVANLAQYYEQSTLFAVTLPAGNLFGQDEGFLLDPSADAGYYLVIPPLPRGAHTIKFSGALPTIGFSVDVTYNLTIG